MTLPNYIVASETGIKYPCTITTAQDTYTPKRGMDTLILFAANRHAVRNGKRKFLHHRTTTNAPDPQP